jgi:hypothetical protein
MKCIGRMRLIGWCALLSLGAACSREPRDGAAMMPDPGTGGVAASGTGGVVGTGGNTASVGTGGMSGAVDNTGAGGATGSGGALGSGGASGSGSATGTGGMSPGGTADAGGTLDAGSTMGGNGPEPGSVENSGTDCVVPALPAAAQLTPFAKHQDPFAKLDGSRITRKSEWRCRRAEIKAQIEQYESGPKPAVAPENVSAQFSGNTLSISVSDSGKSVDFSVDISRPSGAGSNAIPLVIQFNVATLDTSVFTQNGVASIVYDNDSIGAESGGASRGTGLFYDLYGHDHPASSITAWAWGVSRIIDAIEKTPEAHIDARRIAVTGCSRYGKGALMAGALDERVALTIPQESGAGGSASWRVSQAQSDMGENVQTLSNAANEQPWFRADFGQTFGGSNVTKLPFDHHMVMGMVAPRALLVIDNPVDWLGVDSTFTDGSIAHAIWEAFGLPDHMGYWQSSAHTHCAFPAEQRAVFEAYVKKFLVGTGTDDTNILRAESAKADLAAWMEWTPPTLQ